jgi:hypothetical protein
MWWCIPVIPAFPSGDKEYHELEASLGYTVRPCPKNNITQAKNKKKTK